jgi:hypothetical protein
MAENSPSRSLTFEDAVCVWRFRKAGWYQHQIAAYFGCNPGRINEILKEKRFQGSRNAALTMRSSST